MTLPRALVDRVPWLGRRRIPLVRQATSADCAAAALAMVLGYHGRPTAAEDLRQALGRHRGVSAASLLAAGRHYGLQSRAVQVEVEAIDCVPRAAILFLHGSHFVVLDRLRRDRIDIVDPAVGRRSLSRDRLRGDFSGVALLFEPTETFRAAPPRPHPLRRLLRQLAAQRALILRLLSTVILLQVLAAVLPLLMGLLIDRVVPQHDTTLLLQLTVAYCFIQVFTALAGFVRAHIALHLRAQLEAHLTLGFLDHLIELPYAFFQHRTAGDLMVRLGSNNTVREILTSTLLSTFLDGLMASIYLLLLLLASLKLTLLIITLAVARVLLLVLVRRRQRRFVADSLENQAQSQTLQVEMLSGIETLKAMGLEHRAAEDWSRVFVEGLNLSLTRGRLDAIFGVFMNLLAALTMLILMFYGTVLVLDGSWTLGTMIAFSSLASGFLGPVSNLASSGVQFQMLEVYLERINDVLETAPEQMPDAMALTGPLSGSVTLERVSFAYDQHLPGVLDQISVEIQPGSRVAIVGRTGCGKSTMARLMVGLYSPTTGRVLFEGRDLQTLDRRAIRHQIGIVTQEAQLFGGTIRHNIALADPHMPFERVVAAATIACLHDEIVAMPMGYETPLSDRGLSLSGGQRQRLAIARAVASQPRILVLDEATSHLDAGTEERLNAHLVELRCTIILIAHRLTTIRMAERILVLENGRIVEQGAHESLMRLNARYANLVGLQDQPFSAARLS
jgi:ATP-binding cassette subfamily B protein